MPSPDPSVSAAYHYVASQYHKAKQAFAEFYREGMLYLAHVSCETLPETTRRDLAVDLSLAALLGDDVYGFAELIAHPILGALAGTPFSWLTDILNAFNDGDLHAYDALCVAHADALNAQPALVAHERKLREKITILCLLQIVFASPADEREIALQTIADRTKLTVDGVEFLLSEGAERASDRGRHRPGGGEGERHLGAAARAAAAANRRARRAARRLDREGRGHGSGALGGGAQLAATAWRGVM